MRVNRYEQDNNNTKRKTNSIEGNEEKYMEQLGYKEIDHHKQCHAELVERLNKVKLNNGHIDDLLHDLKRLMVVWVIEHIVNEDQKIAQEI